MNRACFPKEKAREFTRFRSTRSTVGQGVRDQLGPSWSQHGQVGPTWPSWSSFCCALPSWKSIFDQLGPSWSSTLSHSIPCTPERSGTKVRYVNRACFPKEKHKIIHRQMGEIFMNFSFWPFIWFGLPGRLLTKGPFRTENTAVPESVVFCDRAVVFRFLYRFPSFLASKNKHFGALSVAFPKNLLRLFFRNNLARQKNNLKK